LTDKYAIKIYKSGNFVGYVQTVRKSRNGYYRITKTKNLNTSLDIKFEIIVKVLKKKLDEKCDKILYKNHEFEIIKVNQKEIRFSKLNILKNKVIREGIFKNRKTLT
jgi:hypothetical protein